MNANVMIKLEDLPQSVTELTTEQELAIVVGGICDRYTSGYQGSHDYKCNRSIEDEVVDETCTDEDGQVWHNKPSVEFPSCEEQPFD